MGKLVPWRWSVVVFLMTVKRRPYQRYGEFYSAIYIVIINAYWAPKMYIYMKDGINLCVCVF